MIIDHVRRQSLCVGRVAYGHMKVDSDKPYRLAHTSLSEEEKKKDLESSTLVFIRCPVD